MKWLRMLFVMIACFCVATVFTAAVGLGMLWWQGALTDDRGVLMLAVLQGVDLGELRMEIEKKTDERNEEQPAFDQVLEARTRAGLDLQMREMALKNAISEFSSLESQVLTEKDRYEKMKKEYDNRLAQLEAGLRDPALLAFQRTLEAMPPAQAKGQILMMLEDDSDPRAMQHVVAIMKTLPLDKQKKLIAEFKTDEEKQTLYDVLKRVRLGDPESSMIEEARENLKKFDAQE